MRHLRNIAIIMLIALAAALVPGGGNATAAVLALITIGFMTSIGLVGVRAFNEQGMLLDSLAERSRLELYGSLGVIALMIAGADELQGTGLGTIIWLTLLVGSGWVIFNVVKGASDY